MAAYTDTYLMSCTLAVVGLSSITAFVPPPNCTGGMFKINSGGGTLYIASGLSQVVGATLYPVGATEVVTFRGPARFFLGAAGATMVVSISTNNSYGISLYPGS